MKKLLRFMKTKSSETRVKTIAVIGNNRGDGFVSTAISILISVVIGALLLAGLYALFGETILPELQNRITQMFNYSG